MSAALFDLTDRIALVTGSSTGLGHAMARGLAQAGATVVLNGRDATRLDAAIRGFRENGLAAHGRAFDVTAEQAIEDNVAAIEKEIGPIDILVNNAGIQRRMPLLEVPASVWREIVDHDLTSAFLVGRAVARRMVSRKRGKIINICSIASELGRPTIAPYTAAKGGLKMLTKAMCCEWAGSNIQVNAIGPGYFTTQMNRPLFEDRVFNDWVRARTPAARWGDPVELIGTAVFLASPASDYVNGQLIFVDGGLTASV